MIQLFKRDTRDKRSTIINNNTSSNSRSGILHAASHISQSTQQDRIREIVIVNKQLDDEWLMTITNCYTDDDDDVRANSAFTISTHTDQLSVLVDILLHNGYKEGMEGLDRLLSMTCNTYENDHFISTRICSRLVISKLLDMLKTKTSDENYYIRLLPANMSILHYNGVLRDSRGQVVSKPKVLLDELQELYEGSCAFDLISTLDNNDLNYTVIDFAYDAEYDKRRRLFYEFGLDSHLDIPVDNRQRLLQAIANSIMSVDVNERRLNLSSSYEFIVHSSESLYAFDDAKKSAYLMKVYASTLIEFGVENVDDLLAEDAVNAIDTHLNVKGEQITTSNGSRDNKIGVGHDGEHGNEYIKLHTRSYTGTHDSKEGDGNSTIKSICIKRGILV